MTKTIRFVLLTTLLTVFAAFGETYTVQSGDTLSKIAQKQLNDATRWKEIAELNNLKEPYTLSLGQQLELPGTASNSVTLQTFPPAKQNETPSTTEETQINLSELEKFKKYVPLVFTAGATTAVAFLWYAIYLLLYIFFLGVGYRFTASAVNLETTLRKCIVAAVSVTLSLLIPVGIVLLARWSNPLQWPPALLIASPFLLSLGYIFLAMYIIRTCLQCRWGLSFVVGFLGGIVGPAFYTAFVYMIMLIILLFTAIIGAIAMLF